MWIIYERTKNNFGDLWVKFLNKKNGEIIESLFSEGEHHQANLMLKALNKGV